MNKSIPIEWLDVLIRWLEINQFTQTTQYSQVFKRRQRIDYDEWVDLLTQCAALVPNDYALGIDLAKLTNLQAFGLLGYVLKSSQSVQQAIDLLQKYERLLYGNNFAKIKFGTKYSQISWVEHRCEGRVDLAIEFSIAAFFIALQQHIGVKGFVDIQVTFPYSVGRERKKKYQELFPAHLHFSECSTETVIRFPNRLLTMQLVGADSFLRNILEAQANAQLSEIPPPQLIEEIKQLVSNSIELGDISLKEVAKTLGRSERTLQRHFKQHKYTWGELVNDVRKDAACKYLKNSDLYIGQIAYRLGYNDPSAFTKAFVRWFNLSPSHWRKMMIDK